MASRDKASSGGDATVETVETVETEDEERVVGDLCARGLCKRGWLTTGLGGFTAPLCRKFLNALFATDT